MRALRLLLASVLGVAGVCSLEAAPVPDFRPNVLFFLADDEIWGGLRIREARDVEIQGNRIVYEKDEPISVEFCGQVDVSSNSHSRNPAGGEK